MGRMNKYRIKSTIAYEATGVVGNLDFDIYAVSSNAAYNVLGMRAHDQGAKVLSSSVSTLGLETTLPEITPVRKPLEKLVNVQVYRPVRIGLSCVKEKQT